MIRSMTGYGSAEQVCDGVGYTLELRSVNHRFLKLAMKLPDALQFTEPALEAVLRDRVSRGAVTCTLRAHGEGSDRIAPLNLAAVQAYVDQLSRVRVPEGFQPAIDLGAVCQLPGATEGGDLDDSSREQCVAIVQALAGRAADALLAMRRAEGQALRTALERECSAMRGLLEQVAAAAPGVVKDYHERLRTRANQLLQGAGLEVEEAGVLRELAFFADRCDITEEVARLGSHLDQFLLLCERDEPVGRTMDFLAQEMLREANTIASKSNDAAIACRVVEIKAAIDRLKEQVQNVE